MRRSEYLHPHFTLPPPSTFTGIRIQSQRPTACIWFLIRSRSVLCAPCTTPSHHEQVVTAQRLLRFNVAKSAACGHDIPSWSRYTCVCVCVSTWVPFAARTWFSKLEDKHDILCDYDTWLATWGRTVLHVLFLRLELLSVARLAFFRGTLLAFTGCHLPWPEGGTLLCEWFFIYLPDLHANQSDAPVGTRMMPRFYAPGVWLAAESSIRLPGEEIDGNHSGLKFETSQLKESLEKRQRPCATHAAPAWQGKTHFWSFAFSKSAKMVISNVITAVPPRFDGPFETQLLISSCADCFKISFTIFESFTRWKQRGARMRPAKIKSEHRASALAHSLRARSFLCKRVNMKRF